MAQSVERVLGKDEVTGSNPVSSSIKKEISEKAYLFFLRNETKVTLDLPRKE